MYDRINNTFNKLTLISKLSLSESEEYSKFKLE